MTSNNNKDAKEDFVSNLEGTSAVEILLIASSVPLGFYLYSCFCRHRLGLSECVAFWIPAILCQSVWSFPWAMVYFISCWGVGMMFRSISSRRDDHDGNSIANSPSNDDLTYYTTLCITIYRACLLCLTCVAILAVDFNLYPRRLAKTEVQGYGWMDLGAASFVIAAGICAPTARGTIPRAKLARIVPVVCMGLLRLVTHKGIEYQEHASEYGLHWNFFFTLALLTPLSLYATRSRPFWMVPSIIMVIYQCALTQYGLQEWIETAPRKSESGLLLFDLFFANREGILGCIGYGSVYYVSEYIASVSIWSSKVNIWIIVSVLTSVWRALEAMGVQVSRRTTNLTFCVWALLVNVLQLALLRLVVANRASTIGMPPLLDAMNRNGLFSFVIANLLTGAVNLSMDTLGATHATALVVLCLYLAAVSLSALAIQRLRRPAEPNAQPPYYAPRKNE